MNVTELLGRLDGVRRAGKEWRARCPTANHRRGDKNPSLYVREGGDGILLICRSANCEPSEICAALGITLADLFYDAPAQSNGRKRPASKPTAKRPARPAMNRTREFYYSPTLRKVRLEAPRPTDGSKPEKTFVWEHRKGGKWLLGIGGEPVPLFTNKPFRDADQLGRVIGFEGEGKVEAAAELGIPGFSFKDLTPAQCEPLADLDACLWPDRDTAGSKLAANAAKILHESRRPRSVRIITPPPGLPEGGDIVDAVTLGWDRARIEHLADEAKSYDAPEADQPAAPHVIGAEAIRLPDMPDTVLDGRLGEICRSRLRDFPIAFAWLATLAAASALVRTAASKLRTNLFVALIGPVHCGKSAVIERANFLLQVIPPLLVQLKAGSAEGLLAKIGNQQGQSVLLHPDELSHLLEKAQITSASFPYILNSLFYRDADELTVARGKRVNFNCRLSIVGGIVDEKFDESFGSATTAGLYDRFLFGVCPTGFEYLWRPIEGAPAVTGQFDEPQIDPDVWEARDEIAKAERLNPRLLEIALRGALICAAVDGRKVLRAADLRPAWELARYQTRARMLLQPNAGKNFEARVAMKILNHLNRHAPSGEWLVLRDVLRLTRAYDYGPSVAERALQAMRFGGAVEEMSEPRPKGPNRRLLRLMAWDS